MRDTSRLRVHTHVATHTTYLRRDTYYIPMSRHILHTYVATHTTYPCRDTYYIPMSRHIPRSIYTWVYIPMSTASFAIRPHSDTFLRLYTDIYCYIYIYIIWYISMVYINMALYCVFWQTIYDTAATQCLLVS